MSDFECIGCGEDKSEEALEFCYECYSDFIDYRFARYITKHFPESIRSFIRDTITRLMYWIKEPFDHMHRYTISGCLTKSSTDSHPEDLIIGWAYQCHCGDEIEVKHER